MEYFPTLNGVEKTILNAGTAKLPNFCEGSKITFHFRTDTLDENGDCKETIDDSKKVGRPMELILGKKFKMPVWEKCLETMKTGEVSKFLVKKNLVDSYPLVSKSYREFAGISQQSKKGHCCGMMAFTEGIGHKDLDAIIREPQNLQFRLELMKVEQPGEYEKEAWVMNPEEKLQVIPQLKETGNELYKQKQYEEACKKYAEALGLLEQLLLREKPGDKEWTDLEKVKIPILSNYAQCRLAQKDYYTVIDYTNQILEKEPNNAKALFRRGKAHAGVWDLDSARKDFIKVAALDATLKRVVQKDLKNLSILQKQKDEEMKSKLYGKVFGGES